MIKSLRLVIGMFLIHDQQTRQKSDRWKGWGHLHNRLPLQLT